MVATPAMLPRTNPPKRAGAESYEEFHPYGTTAWIAEGIATVSLKRYKFTGMERDEETGLQCHGVRYYAPWLGRWTSADPIGLGDGVNRFGYCHGGPIAASDSTGLLGEPLDHGRRTLPLSGYIHMLEEEQGIDFPENKNEVKATRDRRTELMWEAGCIGLSGALSWTAAQLRDRTARGEQGVAHLGPGAPPLDEAYDSYELAARKVAELNARFAQEQTLDPKIGPRGAIVVVFRYDQATRDRLTAKADAFKVDPITHRVDMSAFDLDRNPNGEPGREEREGYVNWDTGWVDTSTNTVWHANVAKSESVYQSTPESFMATDLKHFEPATVYAVVTSDWFDPGKAKDYGLTPIQWPTT